MIMESSLVRGSPYRRSAVAIKGRPSFNPKSFLAKVGEGRSIGEYRKDATFFHNETPRIRSSTSRAAR
jgi:hypothetical protein